MVYVTGLFMRKPFFLSEGAMFARVSPLSLHAMPSTANIGPSMTENRTHSPKTTSFIPTNMSTIQALDSIERLGKL